MLQLSRKDARSVREVLHGRTGYCDRHFVSHMAMSAPTTEQGFVVLGGVFPFLDIKNRKFYIDLPSIKDIYT